MTAAYVCPAGHDSTTGDYCDVCGAAIPPQTGKPAPAPTAQVKAVAAPHCTNCGADRAPDDLFCEVCGLDFTTGKLPSAPAKPTPAKAPAASAPAAAPAAPATNTGWTAVVQADRAFFDKNQFDGASLTFPDNQAEREVALAKTQIRVGRGDDSDIDLNHIDPAVSHHHMRMTLNAAGDAWEVVDEGSSNGTFVDDEPGPMTAGTPVVATSGTRLHIGAFTTIVLRDDRKPKKSS